MSLLIILRLPRISENVIPALYAIQTKNYAVLPKSSGGDKKKKGSRSQKLVLPVEKDVNKLLNYCCGTNIYKEGEDVKLKPDSEYPEWLWSIETEPPKLENLDPNTKAYWRYIRRHAVLKKNEVLKRIRPKQY